MNKLNFLLTLFKQVNLSINNLLKKYLNKLNFNNLSNLARSSNFFFTFVILFVLFISYLLIPNSYNKAEIRIELEHQLLDKFNLNFNLSHKLDYHFLPRPHFTNKKSVILKNQKEISEINHLKIYVSLKNLFSLKNIKVNDVILENANFNLNSKNYNFFIELLDNNFNDNSFEIKDSHIFYQNNDNDVLFINKIINIRYFHDVKNLNSVVVSENEIFNIPYFLEFYDNRAKKKIFSKLNLKFLKLQIENELDYNSNVKRGNSDIILNQKKSKATYEINKNSFYFNFLDRLDAYNFLYKLKVNINPFYSNLVGKTNEINLASFFNPNSLIVQLLKSEMLNNQNLNFNLDIDAKKFENHHSFENIILNSKIHEGLIDIDNTKFNWQDKAAFKISESLIYVNNGELILDGKLDISIKDYKEIYKFLLTPKNYRTEIKKVELRFSYNFDQNLLGFNDIKIDNKIDQNVNKVLKNLIFKNDKRQNKIYFKNIINKAIKFYSG